MGTFSEGQDARARALPGMEGGGRTTGRSGSRAPCRPSTPCRGPPLTKRRSGLENPPATPHETHGGHKATLRGPWRTRLNSRLPGLEVGTQGWPGASRRASGHRAPAAVCRHAGAPSTPVFCPLSHRIPGLPPNCTQTLTSQRLSHDWRFCFDGTFGVLWFGSRPGKGVLRRLLLQPTAAILPSSDLTLSRAL